MTQSPGPRDPREDSRAFPALIPPALFPSALKRLWQRSRMGSPLVVSVPLTLSFIAAYNGIFKREESGES